MAGVFATVPLVIGGTFGGVLVDRFGYRVSSIVADVASGLTVIAIPLLSATVGLPFGVLLALVFLGGLLDPPGDTAKTALMPDLARLARMPLARAAGAQSAVQRTAIDGRGGRRGRARRAARPGAGARRRRGGIRRLGGARRVLRAARRPRPPPSRGRAGEESSTKGGFVAGIRFIASHPLLRAIVLLVTLTNAIDAAGMTVLKPVYATEVLHDPAMLGFMVGCFAAGALTGSAIFGAIGHRYSGRLMFATCFVLAGTPPYLAMALGAPLPVLLPVLALSGLAAGALNPMMATAMYGEIPDGMRARVFGATTAGVAASMPLGALLGGLAVEQVGLVPTLATCAALYLVLGGSPLFIRAFSGLTAARSHGVAEGEPERALEASGPLAETTTGA